MTQHKEPTSSETFKAMVQQTLPSSLQVALEKEEPTLPWCREWVLFFIGMVFVLGFGAIMLRIFWFAPCSDDASPTEVEIHQTAPRQESEMPTSSPLVLEAESEQSNP